ncbi:MAG: lactate utilization protein [Lentilitoribacter sp.]
MSNARQTVLSDIRNAVAKKASDDERAKSVAERLSGRPTGIIPKRGQLKQAARVELFAEMAKKVHSSVTRVNDYDEIPGCIGNYLREHNLPAELIMGTDRRLNKADWSLEQNLTIKKGPSDGKDLVGVSHAKSGIAETGTLLLASGSENPTTINFLADHHIVIISAKDIKGDMESAWGSLNKKDGQVVMPRAVNFVTGPSRSGDIEQKLLLGAHGPRALQIIIVG